MHTFRYLPSKNAVEIFQKFGSPLSMTSDVLFTMLRTACQISWPPV